jgi:ketosteroid isomerase-like protein
MSDHEAVVEANRKFYRAFESLDLESMEQVWLKDRQIVCIHPGWRKLSGWGPVMQSWERIFEGVFEMSFEIGDVDVIMTGDLAVIVVEENLTQRNYDGTMKTLVLTTNVFEKVGNEWFMVMHHGSPVMEPPGSEPQLQ